MDSERSFKRKASTAGLPSTAKENDYLPKRATIQDCDRVRRALELTTRGNIQRPSQTEEKDSKERTANDIPQGALSDVLPNIQQDAASQKNEISAITGVFENRSPSGTSISEAESLWGSAPDHKPPSTAEPGNGKLSEEEKESSSGGNKVLRDIDPVAPAAPVPKFASAADAEGNTLPEEGKHPKPSDREIAPDTEFKSASESENDRPRMDVMLAFLKGLERSSSVDEITPGMPGTLVDPGSSDNETIPDTKSPPALDPSPKSTSRTDPEGTRLSVEEREGILAALDPSLLDPWKPTTPPELDDPILCPPEKMPKMGYFPPPPSLNERIRMAAINARNEIRATPCLGCVILLINWTH